MAKKGKLTSMHMISNKLYKLGIPILPGVITRIIRLLFSCDLPSSVEIGNNTLFAHNGLGTVIHEKAVIGSEVKIMQNVTIGGKNGEGAPIIGDYCFIGAGACILGEVTIGNNVMIGANAVITKNIPNEVVVVGVPGKIIKVVDPSLINKFKN